MIPEKYIHNYIIDNKLLQLVDVTDIRDKKVYDYISEKAKLRSIAANEIVIEFDTDRKYSLKQVKNVCRRLKANGYNYFVFDHCGRSPHIHIYNIQGLDRVDEDIRKEYKKLFTKKYAGSWNFKTKAVDNSLTRNSLIAMEFKEHFKHDRVKRLVDTNFLPENKENKIEINLLKRARDTRIPLETNKLPDKSGMWLVKWLITQDKYLHQMDLIIFKNVAIAMYHNNRLDLLQNIKITENKGHNIKSEILGWYNWVDNTKHFNSWEVKNFFDIHDIDFYKTRKEFDYRCLG